MMEQSDPSKGHDHTVFVRRLNDLVVPDGAAGLYDILHARLPGPVHVVAEGEERVGAEGHAGEVFRDPLPLLLRGELFGDKLVDGVVPLRAADVFGEFQGQDLGMPPQAPDIRLAARVQWIRLCWPAPTPMVIPSLT